jgi:hypothetical protein
VSGILFGKIVGVSGSGKLCIEDKGNRIHEFSFREVEFQEKLF